MQNMAKAANDKKKELEDLAKTATETAQAKKKDLEELAKNATDTAQSKYQELDQAYGLEEKRSQANAYIGEKAVQANAFAKQKTDEAFVQMGVIKCPSHNKLFASTLYNIRSRLSA